MSWRNTDRAFGSRARGLRGIDGSTAGLYGFVAPGTVPTMRWRNTDRSWGKRPRGLPWSGPSGVGLNGLGQDGSTLDQIGTDIGTQTGIDIATSGTIANPPSIPSGGVSPWPATVSNIAQAGFTDAFNILKLLNPVPPGTVMQTGPGGTFISRAAAGQPAPTGLPFGSASGSKK